MPTIQRFLPSSAPLRLLLAVLPASLATAGTLAAQEPTPTPASADDSARTDTGFLDRVITVEGHDYPYQVYVPRGHSPDQPLPVILFLHGAGERGEGGLAQTGVGLAPAIRRAPDRFPAIVVFPQAPRDSTWSGAPARAAMAALDRTMVEFATDPARVYLTGLSMGGHGAWYLAYRNPARFAAVVPVCGWVAPRTDLLGAAPVVPPGDGDPFDALARRLAGVPVWIVHGEMDPVVPVDDSRLAAAAIDGAVYTELIGVGHNAWDPAYGSDRLIDWLFAQRLDAP